MSDFARMMELAMKADAKTAQAALGEVEPQAEDKKPAAEHETHPAPQAQSQQQGKR